MTDEDYIPELHDLELPNCDQLAAGIRAFGVHESRAGAYYKALAEVSGNWGDAPRMAGGVKILLDSWHQTFYRFGALEISALTKCVGELVDDLAAFRSRSIASLGPSDRNDIAELYGPFLDALRGGKRRSPVAVAKTLHLFAPEFFPLWDTDIAIAYGSWWAFSEFGEMEYWPFCWKMKRIATHVADCECVRTASPKRSTLKLIDEYNYSRFTKHWL